MDDASGATQCGAQATDPWAGRLAFHILRRGGAWWITLWLVLVLGGLMGLGAVVGPWVPGAITAIGALIVAAKLVVNAGTNRSVTKAPELGSGLPSSVNAGAQQPAWPGLAADHVFEPVDLP